ncbi:MAG: hypothetical protein DMD48_06195 [Gemmatimonadetes bacterium]|nr:MAG: hypothetical protein DMD48_06195 [Gemmatimonadota bacterium]
MPRASCCASSRAAPGRFQPQMRAGLRALPARRRDQPASSGTRPPRHPTAAGTATFRKQA